MRRRKNQSRQWHPRAAERLERRDCPATVSISGGRDVSEGTTGIALQVTLSEPLTTRASVVVSTAGSSATSTDFTLSPRLSRGLLVFQPGETSKTLTIFTRQDVLRESTERVLVSLTRPTNVSVGTASTAVQILDDDSYSVSMAGPVSAVPAGQSATISIELSSPATKNESFRLTTAAESARARIDFAPLSRRTLTVPRGSKLASLQIPILASSSSERTFVVNAVPATRGTPTPAPVRVAIASPAPPLPLPVLTVANTSVTEGNPGSTNSAVFTLALSAASSSPVSVAYQTANGSANGEDFSARSGVATFAPGQTSATVTVPIIGDSAVEAGETFSLVLSSPTNCTLGNSSALATIINDDTAPPPSLPVLTIAGTSITEGNTGSAVASFVVRLSGSSSQPVSVSYSSVASTATASDFTEASGTLTFAPGETSKVIGVSVRGDTDFEPDETFRVVLSNATGATLGVAEATGTILNDDAAPELPTIGVEDNGDWAEGNAGILIATVPIVLSAASSVPVSVKYRTEDFTATLADNDYLPASGTVVFAPGQTRQAISIQIAGDTKIETDERIKLVWFDPVNAQPWTEFVTTVGIANDDSLAVPLISVFDITEAEGSDPVNAPNFYLGLSLKTFVFTVALSKPSTIPVFVDYDTLDGSAVAATAGVEGLFLNGDYARASGRLEFAPGVSSQTISVNVFSDTVNEQDEMFFLRLSNPRNVAILRGTATATVMNDDPPPPPVPVWYLFPQTTQVVEGTGGFPSVFLALMLALPKNYDFSTRLQVAVSSRAGTASVFLDYNLQTTEGRSPLVIGTPLGHPELMAFQIYLSVVGDSLREGNETFFIDLHSPTGGSVVSEAAGTAIVTIIDDD